MVKIKCDIMRHMSCLEPDNTFICLFKCSLPLDTSAGFMLDFRARGLFRSTKENEQPVLRLANYFHEKYSVSISTCTINMPCFCSRGYSIYFHIDVHRSVSLSLHRDLEDFRCVCCLSCIFWICQMRCCMPNWPKEVWVFTPITLNHRATIHFI